MSVYKVVTTVAGTFTNMDLALDGKRIQLSYDGGSGYQSTDLVDVTNGLVLQWIGVGLSFQDWTITLLISPRNDDQSFGKAKKWALNGRIPQGGGSQVYENINIDQLPAA
jgi:hypothetical protein